MSYEVKADGGFTVMGILARASNAQPGIIGDLWRRFHAMGDAAAIPGRLSDTVICVYCEYASDAAGEFTVVIGCAVDPAGTLPEGMKLITVDAGGFAVFTENYTQPIPAAVAWAKVWETPLERRYQADFDRYGEASVMVHVGVR